MSMKKRVLIAIVAIAAVHAAFYAIPRWWYSRPGVCPEAYENAISLLKEDFGAASVERGIVAIPKTPISVPYRGVSYCFSSARNVELYIRIAGDQSWILHIDWHGVVRAKRVSFAKARQLWALFTYLDSADTTCARGPVPQDSRISLAADYLADRTWPWSSRKDKYEDTVGLYDERPLTAIVREIARGAAIRNLPVSDDGWLRDREAGPAIEAIIRASLPPRSDWDRMRIGCLADYYLHTAGRHALPLLRKIDACNHKSFPAFCYKLPLIGKMLQARFDAGQIDINSASPYLRVLATLEGKSNDGQFAALVKIAFPDAREGAAGGGSAREAAMASDDKWAARYTLGRGWPAKWRDLLVENYGKLTSLDKKYFLPSNNPGIPGDERFVRMVADDAALAQSKDFDEVEARVHAVADIYRMTKDAAAIARLKDIVTHEKAANPAAAGMAMAALIDLYSNDRGVGDMPAFAMEALRSGLGSVVPDEAHSNQPRNICERILQIVGRGRSEGFIPLLAAILNEPERMFGADCGEAEKRVLAERAAMALGEYPCTASADALVRFLDRPAAENGPVERAAVASLRKMGGAEALGALERMRHRLEERPLTTGATGTAADDHRIMSDNLQRAMLLINIRSAGSPRDRYASLSAAERSVITCADLRSCFGLGDLQALLVDESCAEAKVKVMTAICETRYLEGEGNH